MNILDTRDLAEKRTELQEEILTAFNEQFNTEHESFDDIDFNSDEYDADDISDFEDIWNDEMTHISEIDSIEDIFSSEFDYGVTLVENDDFEDYTRELLEELGYIPKDFPTWIEIDWSATSANVEQDYTDVTYRGTSYLGRA